MIGKWGYRDVLAAAATPAAAQHANLALSGGLTAAATGTNERVGGVDGRGELHVEQLVANLQTALREGIEVAPAEPCAT
jgi:hypothetical protein